MDRGLVQPGNEPETDMSDDGDTAGSPVSSVGESNRPPRRDRRRAPVATPRVTVGLAPRPDSFLHQVSAREATRTDPPGAASIGRATMSISDQIRRQVERLPVSVQAEVLGFVQYLLARAARREDGAWSGFSLAGAMRGMEDEPGPEYTTYDLRTVF